MKTTSNKITGTALLLALTIVFQSLRIFVPLPFITTTFLIGSLVNCCLIIALLRYGLFSAIILATLAPIIALLQGMLITPLFLVPIVLGQLAYMGIFYFSRSWGDIIALIFASLIKFGVIYFLFVKVLILFEFSAEMTKVILFTMGWPQIVTGIIGGSLGMYIYKKIEKNT